jgi:hypothetical protein
VQPATPTTIAEQTRHADAATDSQRDLIAKLAGGLRVRNVDPWGEELTSGGASELIDQLRLRQVSQRINRPITVELSDAAAVRQELERVTAVDSPRPDDTPKRKARGTAGVRIRHVDPQPRRELTAKEQLARHAAMDRGPIGPYATGRFSESTGHGGHSSYSAQRAESLGEQRDNAPALTDPQEQLIIKLQEQKGDSANVAATVEQAGTEIERLKEAPGPVTRRQAAYLADLQRRAGLQVVTAANRDAASAEISRLREHLGAGTTSQLTPAHAQPVAGGSAGRGIEAVM